MKCYYLLSFRKFTTSIMLLWMMICAPFIQAQNEKLFVLEEKTWECSSESPGYPSETNVFAFDGEKVINGITYKRMTCNGEYYAALRQDGQKVYVIYESSGEEEKVLYDFGLQVGDSFLFDNFTDTPLYLAQTDYIEVNGTQLRRMKFVTNSDYFNNPSSTPIDFEHGMSECWVEGIGSYFGPASPDEWCVIGPYVKMEKCTLNGREIFENSDFLNAPVMNVPTITNTNESKSDDAIYDLQGRQLNAVPEHGIYIRNSKKVMRR